MAKATPTKPVSRMNIEEVKAAIQALRGRLDRCEITPEMFRQMREPLGARFKELESTPENLPERLMWFHNESKTRPQVLIAAPLVEAAEEIERLRAIVAKFEEDAAGRFLDNLE